MSQFTLFNNNTYSQEFALPAFKSECGYSAAPFGLFGIDKNNILAAGNKVGQGEVALSDSWNFGLQKLENKLSL